MKKSRKVETVRENHNITPEDLYGLYMEYMEEVCPKEPVKGFGEYMGMCKRWSEETSQDFIEPAEKTRSKPMQEKPFFKVWVPIRDVDGNTVDQYREDWFQFDNEEHAAKCAYENACLETWGESNEYFPTMEGIEVVVEG